MSLLIPLGLLGLLSLLVLLIIYFIKPNYEQKFVSSTFVWKLSLKYRKKRIPINKLRDLLILLCQIFILILLAFIISQPVVVKKGTLRDNEKVVVIDASASMLATTQYDTEKYTRFEAAVDKVMDLADKVFDKDGTLTVILAGAKSEELFTRVGRDSENAVLSKLAEMKTARDAYNNPSYCTYGSADIEGAMTMAEAVTVVNPLAEVLLYTGKQYLNPNGVTVVDMSRGAEEVNVAILDVRAVLEEGYYTFYADVVSYGENAEVDVQWLIDVDVYSNGSDVSYVEPVTEVFHRSLKANEVTTVIFDTNSQKKPNGEDRPVTDYVYEYVSATATTVVEGDAIAEDNSVTLYGGVRPSIKIQYASPNPNKFFSSALMAIGNTLRKRWDVDIDEVRGETVVPKLEGYDLYIFEYNMPSTLPTDGVVLLISPTQLPGETGILLGKYVYGVENKLSAPEPHPLAKYMNLSNILVTSYTPISTYPEGYDTVMQCDGAPVFIAKNTADEKIAVMTFGLNYSDIAVSLEYPALIYNIFEYFIPSTFTKFIFDVNDSITLNARGGKIELSGGGVKDEITLFPAEYNLTQVGSYTTTQSLFGNGGELIECFFVKMPAKESNIFLVEDVMPGSVTKPLPELTFDDLLVYFAAALVVLVLLEWWLQSRTRV